MLLGPRKILLVDDDLRMLRLAQRILELEGYDVMKAADGHDALRILEDASPDLILLDVMMPGINGFDVCSRVREFSEVPVIMVTAKGGEEDVVKGFVVGADDYVTKPFQAAELVARVKAVLGRANPERGVADFVYNYEGLEINADAHTVAVNGRQVVLTATEFALLAYLAIHAGRVVTTTQILADVWESDRPEDTHVIQTTVSRLRRKLGEYPRKPKHVMTESGIGYYVRRAPHSVLSGET